MTRRGPRAGLGALCVLCASPFPILRPQSYRVTEGGQISRPHQEASQAAPLSVRVRSGRLGAKAQSLPRTPPDRCFQRGHTPLRLCPRGRCGDPGCVPGGSHRGCAPGVRRGWRTDGVESHSNLQVRLRASWYGLSERERGVAEAEARLGAGHGCRPAPVPAPPAARAAGPPAGPGGAHSVGYGGSSR